MESSSFDAVDRAIIYHLQRNARKPLTDIADAVNVSDNTVRSRIQSLEDEGAIEGYQVNVNYDEMGVQHYYLFTCSARVSKREGLARETRQHDSVVEVVTLMTGRNNVIVYGVGEEKDDVTDLATDLDDLGLDIEHEHLIRRHDRNPFTGFRLDENV